MRGRTLVPALQGTVAAAGHADVVLVGGNLVSGGATLGGRVLTVEGQPTGEGAFEVLTVAAAEGAEPDLVIGRLHSLGLAPGRYLLELRRSVSGRVAISHGSFVVAPVAPPWGPG